MIRKKTALVEGEVLATAHDLAVALHRVGALTDGDMREMDKLYLTPRATGVDACAASGIEHPNLKRRSGMTDVAAYSTKGR